MTHDTQPAALLLPATFAIAGAIFSFGKRKSEPAAEEPESIPAPPDPDDGTDTDEDDTEGETLPVLATFSLGDDLYEDRAACEQVWDALALPVRVAGTDDPTRFFALTAFDPAPSGRDAVALTACKLAQDATQRGYSVLLLDANVSRPTLHKLPLFAPREGVADAAPVGMADFLRGDATRLEPLLKLAWRTEGLLLLPAGTDAGGEETLTNGATWERLIRLATPLADIVLLVAPPVFAPDDKVRNQDMLPKMDGVLVAYPSVFSASSDTEALERMESMSVPQVGAIVAPPASYDEESTVSTVAVAEIATIPASESTVFPEESVTPEEATASDKALTSAYPLNVEPVFVPTPEAEPDDENVVADVADETSVAEPGAPSEAEDGTVPESREAEPATVARPSFLSAPTPNSGEKPRRDARRAVPIENVPIYNTAPGYPSRPAPMSAAAAATVIPTQSSEIMSTLNTAETQSPQTQDPVPGTYRPDVSIEMLPSADTPAVLTLRADVGGSGNGPVLLLEIRTLAKEVRRLRADNPGSHASATANAALLVLESLTAATAPEDATTLRLVVRESSAEGAATLLEALLETPDALRIKSGKATAAGVPPVRFEVTTEPDDTTRFRATVPPLDGTPSLFVDLERTTTAEGRLSRVVLRLA